MRKVLGQDGPPSPAGPLHRVLQRLKGRGLRRCGTGWEARCPAHEDRKPSLTINANGNGDVLLCCHKGCAAEALGLTMQDLFRNGARRKRRIVERFFQITH